MILEGLHTPRRDRSEHGVTLAEILVVVAIIGLFVVVAVPALGNYIRSARVRSSNDTLVGDLRAIRYIAITNRTNPDLGNGQLDPGEVSFDQVARSYSFLDTRGNDANGDGTVDTITRTLEIGTDFTNLTNVPIGFKSDGSISSNPATIVIQGPVAQGVVHQFTISVSSVGRVSSVFARI